MCSPPPSFAGNTSPDNDPTNSHRATAPPPPPTTMSVSPFAFTCTPLSPLPSARPRAPRHLCPTSALTPPTATRRALLAAALALTLPARALAYSSPYNPSKRSETPLPDRLYEEQVKRVVTTATGLQYFDLSVGTGREALSGDLVSVYYTSRLRGLNGIKIQSSFDDPSAPPLLLRIGDPAVVPGVSETLQGMRVGGKRRAVLPPSIAYKNPDMKPAVTEFFARRRLLSVLETQRDATIVFE